MLRNRLSTAASSITVAAMLTLFSSLSALAADWDLKIGAGIGGEPDYEGSDEYEAVPVLLARIGFDEHSIDLIGTRLKATLLSGGVFSAGPVINYRGERDDVDEGFKDVGVTLNLELGGGEGFGLTGILSYKRLLDDAEDSPVVDDVGDENQIFGGVALTYSF